MRTLGCTTTFLLRLILAALLELLPVVASVKCFSCASAEYGQLFAALGKSMAGGPQFNRYCDTEEAVQTRAPVENCQAACITVFEPHYFGGLQSRERPFTFIRGCAEKIFAVSRDPRDSASSRPREIDFLHVDPICLPLHLTQIYPHVQANERVQVCSCVEDGCNYLIRPSSSSSTPPTLPLLFLLLLVLL